MAGRTCLYRSLSRPHPRPRPGPGAWLVGGSVRDLLLGRPVTDVDLVVEATRRGRPRAGASAGRRPFPLSERHGAWRVVHEGSRSTCRRPGQRPEDMGQRDFTINAMALPLAGGELIDPFGGRPTLSRAACGSCLRRVFDDDPLRLLRLARLARSWRSRSTRNGRSGAARRRAQLADPAER